MKHNLIMLQKKDFFLKQDFFLSVKYSLILCFKWKDGRYCPSADGGTFNSRPAKEKEDLF